MTGVAVRARSVDVEQHHLWLRVFGVPVVLGLLDEGLVVEDVVEFG